MKSVAIYCGSALGHAEHFARTAREVGQRIAQRGLTLVYGGGCSGLMGVMADGALDAGGKVVGVMPHLLVESEIAHPHLTELYIVETMHERKAKMAELADGFVALPGGSGTFEEIFEQWTWAQLGIHQKPCAFLNVAGYYDAMFAMIEASMKNGFTLERHVNKLICSDNFDDILQRLEAYQPPVPKWTEPAEA